MFDPLSRVDHRRIVASLVRALRCPAWQKGFRDLVDQTDASMRAAIRAHRAEHTASIRQENRT
jgi:hypothetical protein